MMTEIFEHRMLDEKVYYFVDILWFKRVKKPKKTTPNQTHLFLVFLY